MSHRLLAVLFTVVVVVLLAPLPGLAQYRSLGASIEALRTATTFRRFLLRRGGSADAGPFRGK